jgi:hypothetical protein
MPRPEEPTASPPIERDADERLALFFFAPAFFAEDFFAELFLRPALLAFAIFFPFLFVISK